MARQGAFVVRKEAVFAVCNATIRGTEEQLRALADMGAVPVLAASLSVGPRQHTVCVLGCRVLTPVARLFWFACHRRHGRVAGGPGNR